MEQFYKQQYLKDISAHAELLMYDWSEPGETEVIVEDIERIDFDRFDKHDPKMKDWRFNNEWEWCEARMLYTYEKSDLMNYFNVPRFDVPEVVRTAEEGEVLRKVWFNVKDEFLMLSNLMNFNQNYFCFRLLECNTDSDTMQTWEIVVYSPKQN